MVQRKHLRVNQRSVSYASYQQTLALVCVWGGGGKDVVSLYIYVM